MAAWSASPAELGMLVAVDLHERALPGVATTLPGAVGVVGEHLREGADALGERRRAARREKARGPPNAARRSTKAPARRPVMSAGEPRLDRGRGCGEERRGRRRPGRWWSRGPAEQTVRRRGSSTGVAEGLQDDDGGDGDGGSKWSVEVSGDSSRRGRAPPWRPEAWPWVVELQEGLLVESSWCKATLLRTGGATRRTGRPREADREPVSTPGDGRKSRAPARCRRPPSPPRPRLRAAAFSTSTAAPGTGHPGGSHRGRAPDRVVRGRARRRRRSRCARNSGLVRGQFHARPGSRACSPCTTGQVQRLGDLVGPPSVRITCRSPSRSSRRARPRWSGSPPGRPPARAASPAAVGVTHFPTPRERRWRGRKLSRSWRTSRLLAQPGIPTNMRRPSSRAPPAGPRDRGRAGRRGPRCP